MGGGMRRRMGGPPMGGPMKPGLQEPAERKLSDRELLRRIRGIIRPYLPRLAVLVGVMAVNGAVGVFSPLLYKQLLDRALPLKDTALLNWVAGGLIAVAVVGGLLGLLTRYLSTLVGTTLVFDLRQRMYEHQQRLSMGFFTDRSSGELVSRFQQDVAGTQSAVAVTLPSLVNNSLTALTTVVAMFALDWRLTLAALALIPFLVFPARRAEKKLRNLQRESLELSAKMSSVVSETMNVSGAMLTRLHGQQQAERQRFREVSEQVRSTRIRSALATRSLGMTLGLAVAFGTTMVYWGGGHLVISEQLSVGTLVAFTVYLRRLYQPLVDLSSAQVEVSNSLASFERVFESLDAQIDVKEAPDAVRLTQLKGEVRFEQVTFAYPRPKLGGTPDAKALQDVSFEIRAGELVALVGPSGAGKSTLAHLLMRLYDPGTGRIVLDGHDLKSLTLDSLRQHVGLVTQDTYLFHDTIRANLQYANPTATQQQIEEACRKAAVHEAILQLPQGYDTVVGESGYRLSGGERQRLSIARVILKNPSLLILDEPTAHLDARSEAELQTAMESVFAGRTCLVIAHRLSTVRKANRVLVLEKGRLVEHGTHTQLLEAKGLYASLTYLQSGPAAAGT
jgi:ATP-binding cassette subfamily B protein